MISEILYYFCLMHSLYGEDEQALMDEHDCNYWIARAGCIPVMMVHRLCRKVATSLPVTTSMGCSGRVNVKLNTIPTNTCSLPHDTGELSLILCLFTSLLT